jgi:hypothetical protein
MRRYMGVRDPGTVPGREHEGRAPRVLLIEAETERPLTAASAPSDYPISLEGGFEWGYGGSGPINLAAALLNDSLGFLPTAKVVVDFCDCLVVELPRLRFELPSEIIHARLDVRLTSGSELAREVAGPKLL